MNRHLVELIHYGIKSAELKKSAEVIQSDEASQIYEESIDNESLFISSKSSPKQFYRELFIRKIPDESFLENYFLPNTVRRLIEENELANFVNPAESKEDMVKNMIKLIKENSLAMRMNSMHSINNNKLRQLNDRNSNAHKRNSSKRINTTTLGTKSPDNTTKRFFSGTAKLKKKPVILVKVESQVNENNFLNDIFKNDQIKYDYRNKLKIMLNFLEHIVERIENYGFNLNEDVLKIQLDK